MAIPRFDKILVAIRGEAATPVIRTAQRMGLRAVAVFSDAERNLPYVHLADEAWYLDGTSSAGSASASSANLCPERILAIARACGAQAIHPGYGNLSQDLELAESCFRRSLIYIGSSPASIELLQSKTVARFVVEDAQVPLVPGYHGAEQSLPVLQAKAEEIGYPILIRGDAADGGAATRLVMSAELLSAEIASAKSALKAAGLKDRLLLERLIADARHVEIPVFIDQHGNGVSFPERDCSLRHQHQTLILESPASTLPERVRKALGDAALRCAKTLQCMGGITASFILDPSDGFYFIGLKPHIEVDSSLADRVTGQNLVEWQIRVASGEPLPCAQNSLVRLGHAIEANIYAVAPAEPCEPATPGPSDSDKAQTTPDKTQGASEHERITGIRLWHRPDHVSQVQLSELYSAGDTVAASAQARIARLCTWDESRPGALQRLQAALRATAACGIATNLDYLHRVSSLPEFAEALVTTRFTSQHHNELCVPLSAPSARVVAMAAIAWLTRDQISQIQQATLRDIRVTPLQRTPGESHSLELAWNGRRYLLNIDCASDGYRVQDEQTATCTRASYYNDALILDLGAHTEKGKVFSDNDLLCVFKDGSSYQFDVVNHSHTLTPA